jgi:hypothetical protein
VRLCWSFFKALAVALSISKAKANADQKSRVVKKGKGYKVCSSIEEEMEKDKNFRHIP